MKVDDFNIANKAVVAGPWIIKLIIIKIIDKHTYQPKFKRMHK